MAVAVHIPSVSPISTCTNTRQTRTYCSSTWRDSKPHLQCVSGFHCELKMKSNNRKRSLIESSERESVSEQRPGAEGVCENYSQKTLPHWGNLSDQIESVCEQRPEAEGVRENHSENTRSPYGNLSDQIYSVCEHRTGAEGVCDNYSQNTLPPWGNLSNQIDSVCEQRPGAEGVCENYSENTQRPRGNLSDQIEFACEQRPQADVFCENYSQNTLPPWDNLSDQIPEYQNHSDYRSETSTNSVCSSDNKVFYLEERDEQILSKRVLILSRSNKTRSALTLYRSMVFSNLLPNSHACNSLISCMLRNGRLDDALNVLYFMKSRDLVTGHTYSLILKAVAQFHGSNMALRIFNEAERDEETKKHIDIVVYNTLISIFGRANEWANAEGMWRKFQENGQIGTAATYRMLICTFVRCGQNELALDAYDEMTRNGLGPHEDAMQAIVGACTREGKWSLALHVFRNMLNNKLKPSLVTCNALVNSLGKASQIELVLEVYSLMKSLGYLPDAYTWNSLICALNRANRFADALRLFESIRQKQHEVLNVHIYNACLMSCQRLGLWEKALKIVWEMEVSGFSLSVTSYNLVIGACEVARNPKVALQVYEYMARLKLSPDVFTRLSLVRGCVWGSLWDEVEEILKAAPNGSLYNAAIQGMCLRGKGDLARKMYMRMHEIGLKPDGKTRALMLQNLPRG